MEHDTALKAEELAELMRTRMGIRLGADFAGKVDKAGRRLPRWARRDAALIIEAADAETHPRLATQVDRKKVAKAVKNLRYFLERQDPWARQKARLLDTLALVAFALFVTLALVLAVMVWRGLI